MVTCRAGRRLHALPSGTPRIGSHPGSTRRPRRSSSIIRKPHVRAEGHPAYFILIYRCEYRLASNFLCSGAANVRPCLATAYQERNGEQY